MGWISVVQKKSTVVRLNATDLTAISVALTVISLTFNYPSDR